jgi:hypothetical protein
MANAGLPWTVLPGPGYPHFEDALSFKPADNEATSLVQGQNEQRRTVLIQEVKPLNQLEILGWLSKSSKKPGPCHRQTAGCGNGQKRWNPSICKQLRSRKARYDALIAEADGKWQKKSWTKPSSIP